MSSTHGRVRVPEAAAIVHLRAATMGLALGHLEVGRFLVETGQRNRYASFMFDMAADYCTSPHGVDCIPCSFF